MKKLLMYISISILMIACVESKKINGELSNGDPFSGVVNANDDKAKIFQNNIKLFSQNDFSYVSKYLAQNFTLKTATDTTVVANGPEEAINYWKNIHTIFDEISFEKGLLQTYYQNNGDVWTSYFGTLYAKGKFTGNDIVIPIDAWIKWENDKIIQQIDMLDSKYIAEEIEASIIID